MVLLATLMSAGIGIFQNSCREKSLFVFRELDLRIITGGNLKTHLGGVLTLYWFVFTICCVLAFLTHYTLYNTRTDFQETSGSMLAPNEIQNTFILELKLYGSRYMTDP